MKFTAVIVSCALLLAAAGRAASTESDADPNGRRVTYYLDGKPMYDTPPVVDSAKPEPKKSSKSEKKSSKGSKSGDAVPVVTETVVPPAQTAPSPAATVEADLTADKPGSTTAAKDEPLLAAMTASGPVDSRAKKCFGLLGDLKTNIETASRCLNNRGKENARLMFSSEQICDNITTLADIWPKNTALMERCATVKRLALMFNDELNQTPWKWTQVRWSFDALLKEMRPFREYAKTVADAEPPPIAVYDKKTNTTKYVDPPDPNVDPVIALHDARLKAERDELERVKRGKSAHEESKDALKTDLDGSTK